MSVLRTSRTPNRHRDRYRRCCKTSRLQLKMCSWPTRWCEYMSSHRCRYWPTAPMMESTKNQDPNLLAMVSPTTDWGTQPLDYRADRTGPALNQRQPHLHPAVNLRTRPLPIAVRPRLLNRIHFSSARRVPFRLAEQKLFDLPFFGSFMSSNNHGVGFTPRLRMPLVSCGRGACIISPRESSWN